MTLGTRIGSNRRLEENAGTGMKVFRRSTVTKPAEGALGVHSQRRRTGCLWRRPRHPTLWRSLPSAYSCPAMSTEAITPPTETTGGTTYHDLQLTLPRVR